MNYELAALKLLCSQLTKAKADPTPSSSSSSLSGILFQRAWLQGILVSESSQDGNFLLDDGTGVIQLSLSSDFLHRNWNIGMYVMVVGVYVAGSPDEPPMIKVHKMVDLSPFPDREAMWHLEVTEAYKMFYQNFE